MEAQAPKHPGGRTAKDTPELRERLKLALDKHVSYRCAAHYAGIAESTLHEWRSSNREFSEWFDEVVANAELTLAIRADGSKPDDAKWLLERSARYRQDWGTKTLQEHSGANGGPALAIIMPTASPAVPQLEATK